MGDTWTINNIMYMCMAEKAGGIELASLELALLNQKIFAVKVAEECDGDGCLRAL